MYCTRCGNPADHKRYCTQCGLELNKILARVAQLNSDSNKRTVQENTQDQPADLLIGRTIDNKYYIESRLGIGGMGAVYCAKRLNIGDRAAIKILNPDQALDSRSVERFHREAKVGASLRHPNAVTVYDFGVSKDGLIYFVMELAEGDDLRNIIQQSGQISQTVAADILTQVCAALDEAHQKNIVHRDLKPENILVQATANGRRVKVLDFGIASLSTLAVDKLTQPGGVIGTPHYMSPEQCMGEDVDRRSDIYSLGIILFEMLTGTTPFESTTPTAIAVQQVNKVPPSVRSLNPRISPEVEAVVMHALKKSPEERPQTASALAEELLAAVNAGNKKTAIARKAAMMHAPTKARAVASRKPGKRNVFVSCSIAVILLFAIAAASGFQQRGKTEANVQTPPSPAAIQTDPTPIPSPELQTDQTINAAPDELSVKLIPVVDVKPPVPKVCPTAKKKVVATKSRVASNRKVASKKSDSDEKDEKDDSRFDRRRRAKNDDDDDDNDRRRRYRFNASESGFRDRFRYRHNSFGPNFRDGFNRGPRWRHWNYR